MPTDKRHLRIFFSHTSYQVYLAGLIASENRTFYQNVLVLEGELDFKNISDHFAVVEKISVSPFNKSKTKAEFKYVYNKYIKTNCCVHLYISDLNWTLNNYIYKKLKGVDNIEINVYSDGISSLCENKINFSRQLAKSFVSYLTFWRIIYFPIKDFSDGRNNKYIKYIWYPSIYKQLFHKVHAPEKARFIDIPRVEQKVLNKSVLVLVGNFRDLKSNSSCVKQNFFTNLANILDENVCYVYIKNHHLSNIQIDEADALLYFKSKNHNLHFVLDKSPAEVYINTVNPSTIIGYDTTFLVNAKLSYCHVKVISMIDDFFIKNHSVRCRININTIVSLYKRLDIELPFLR